MVEMDRSEHVLATKSLVTHVSNTFRRGSEKGNRLSRRLYPENEMSRWYTFIFIIHVQIQSQYYHLQINKHNSVNPKPEIETRPLSRYTQIRRSCDPSGQKHVLRYHQLQPGHMSCPSTHHESLLSCRSSLSSSLAICSRTSSWLVE